jgi:toxin ParE1/3/4
VYPRDFANILKWTTENFGSQQAGNYRDTLMQAIGELANGLDVPGSKARDELMLGLRTRAEGRIIEIGRILHDQMDLQRHLPFPPGKGGDDRSAELLGEPWRTQATICASRSVAAYPSWHGRLAMSAFC